MTKVTRSTNPTTLLVIMMFIGCFALTKHASAQATLACPPCELPSTSSAPDCYTMTHFPCRIQNVVRWEEKHPIPGEFVIAPDGILTQICCDVPDDEDYECIGSSDSFTREWSRTTTASISLDSTAKITFAPGGVGGEVGISTRFEITHSMTYGEGISVSPPQASAGTIARKYIYSKDTKWRARIKAQAIKGYTMTETCTPPPNHSFEAYHCRTTAFDIGPWVDSREWQIETVVRSCDNCWDEDNGSVIQGEECFDEIVPL